jgi:hypothetical protein
MSPSESRGLLTLEVCFTHSQNSWTYSFNHVDTHDGLGHTWNYSACALDSVLSKQIQMLTPVLLTLLHLSIPSFRSSLSLENTKNYSSLNTKKILFFVPPPTCHTMWGEEFRVFGSFSIRHFSRRTLRPRNFFTIVRPIYLVWVWRDKTRAK